MSTSPSRAHIAVSGKPRSPLAPQPFPYSAILRDSANGVSPASNAAAHHNANDSNDAAAVREAQALSRGRLEGKAEAQKAFGEKLAKERSQLAAAIAAFAVERTDYFRKVEAEVVQLALSIARKILHREAQVDPLLLAGMVRVALEQIDGASKVALRVHPQIAADWRTCLNTQLEASVRPEIVEDPAQPVDRCTLQTSMGEAVIGLDVQLKEIENGFADLLAVRPGAGS